MAKIREFGQVPAGQDLTGWQVHCPGDALARRKGPGGPSNNIAVIECQIGSPRSEHTTHRELMSPTALRSARRRHAYSVPCVLDHDVRDSPGSDAGHILDWPGKNHRYA